MVSPPDPDSVAVGDRLIGPGHHCLVVDEVAQKHDGSLGTAHACQIRADHIVRGRKNKGDRKRRPASDQKQNSLLHRRERSETMENPAAFSAGESPKRVRQTYFRTSIVTLLSVPLNLGEPP